MKNVNKVVLYSVGIIAVIACTFILYNQGKDERTKQVQTNKFNSIQNSSENISSTINIIITSLIVPEKICDEYNKTWTSSSSPADDIASRKVDLINANMFSLMRDNYTELTSSINNIEKPTDSVVLNKYDIMMDLYSVYKDFVQLANSTDGSGVYEDFNKKRTELTLKYKEIEQKI